MRGPAAPASATLRRSEERPILTPSHREQLPSESRLESTALHLEAQQRHRQLIQLVEAWAEVGDPTNAAKLAQARAFYALRQMDRAWIRLRDLVEGPEASVEALALAATLFLDRGWPSRARAPLDRALADHPDDVELRTLYKRLSEPAIEPDDRIREIANDDNIEALLPLAEAYLATGAFLKGQSVLEALKRHHPDATRVDDLLWVLRGDFSAEAPLAELAATWGPDLSQLADLADEAEHTESVNMAALHAHLGEDVDTGAFPALFRGVDDDEDSEEGDVTQTLGMASRVQMLDPPKQLEDDDDDPDLGAGDTQIMRVILSEAGPAQVEAARGQMHNGLSDADSAFDLASYREQMGMFGGGALASDFGDDLEGEDDDLIVLTRRDQGELADELGDDPTTAAMELEPDPTSSEVGTSFAARVLAEARAEDQARAEAEAGPRTRRRKRKPATQTGDGASPTPPVEVTQKSRPPVRRRRQPGLFDGWTPWLVVLAALLFLAGVTFAGLLVVQILT